MGGDIRIQGHHKSNAQINYHGARNLCRYKN